MADDSRIRALLEEILDSGRSPEEVCRACPELLPAVREGLRRLHALEGEIAAMFPAGGGAGHPAWPPGSDLPTIPGYTVLSELGRGGMGVVYKARHLKLTRTVAIKMLLAGSYAAAPQLERFLREAQAIAVLRHPHIIQVFDVGELNGQPYFSMEYLEGGSLSQKLAGVPQPAREAAEMVATLAEAIQVAHTAGIIHRDLKPANILLTADGSPKIGDFGLARTYTGGPDLTVGGTRLGTPSYMSPEQATGRQDDIGPAADTYSLGAVLYEMLTGRPPFMADTPAETERQVIAEDPAPPSRLNARVPRDLETICLKCLCKDPARRYASASELAADLRRFLRGEPIAARRAGPLERAGKWVRRHPAHAAAWLGGLVAAGAIAVSMLWMASQRAAIGRAVAEDLATVVRLEAAADWNGARNTLERAKTRVRGAARAPRLSVSIAERERELDLVDRLGEMRFGQRASTGLALDKRAWWAQYHDAFAKAGLLSPSDAPDAFAARIRQSPARAALVAAMDDMAVCAANPADLEWLLSATRLADPDPWRDRARDLALWSDPSAQGAVAALARDAPVESQPAQILLNLAGRLLAFGSAEADAEAEALIRRVQAAHPSDFWANFALAETLDVREDADAIGYYRAAVAIRPSAGAAHFNLAQALAAHGRFDDAIESMSRAAALDQNSWLAHYNLSAWLLRQQRFEDAAKEARIAMRIDDPQQYLSHSLLGSALARQGKYCDAAESFRRAVSLHPGDERLQSLLDQAVRECDSASGGPPTPTGP